MIRTHITPAEMIAALRAASDEIEKRNVSLGYGAFLSLLSKKLAEVVGDHDFAEIASYDRNEGGVASLYFEHCDFCDAITDVSEDDDFEVYVAKRISIATIRVYLKNRGWRTIPSLRKEIEVWARTDETAILAAVNLPVASDEPDRHVAYVLDAAREIARYNETTLAAALSALTTCQEYREKGETAMTDDKKSVRFFTAFVKEPEYESTAGFSVCYRGKPTYSVKDWGRVYEDFVADCDCSFLDCSDLTAGEGVS